MIRILRSAANKQLQSARRYIARDIVDKPTNEIPYDTLTAGTKETMPWERRESLHTSRLSSFQRSTNLGESTTMETGFCL